MAENQGRQFRILYRDFLSRILDLELLSSRGDIERLQAQFGALLGAFSLIFAISFAPRYALSKLPAATLGRMAWIDLDLLIATSMAIAGVFTVLAWNTFLPDRRDSLILGLLPVRPRTIFAAKLAALSMTLGASVIAVNAFTGIAYPFVLAPANAGVVGLLRPFLAYWITMLLAGGFISSFLLSVQGVAAHLLPHRLFLKLSSFLQLAAFFAILGIYFLKPVFPTHALPYSSWLPSFWFLGLYQQLIGAGTPAFAALARQAELGLLIAVPLAFVTFAMAFQRHTRRIIEQPDIAPADRTRRPGRLLTILTPIFLHKPIDRAIFLFSARTVARSRHHRLLLAAYAGIGLAISLARARDLVYADRDFLGFPLHELWNQPNKAMLIGSFVLLLFTVMATRAIFSMPIALPANWIFRITAVYSPPAYCRAARRALFGLSALPVWCAWAVLYCAAWPWQPVAQHLLYLALSAILMGELALYGFRKIPFTCSYLPGKSNLHLKLGLYALIFIFLMGQGVVLEMWSLSRPTAYTIILAILAAVTFWAWRRTTTYPVTQILFEELPPSDVSPLDLHGDAPPTDGSYLDAGGGAAPSPYRPRSSGLISVFDARSEIPSAPFSWEQLLRDFLGGFRILVRAPGFSAAAVILIALGLGWNTTIYSMVHAILSKPAPGIAADGLVTFGVSRDGRIVDPGMNSIVEYERYASTTQTMESMLAYMFERFTMGLEDGSTYRMRGTLVTDTYFDTLRVRPALGRVFTADESRGAAPLAAMIAWPVWQTQFHGAPDILGRTILLNGLSAIIVGVTPEHFHGTNFAPNLEVCVPIIAYARERGADGGFPNRLVNGIGIHGRLKPGVSLGAAQAEFNRLAQLLESEYPQLHGKRPLLANYSATAFGPTSGPQTRMFMGILMAVAILTLLIVCANIANLALARSMARQRELAVRLSLGASAGRIARMLFAEGLVLALTAAAAAWIFASWATRAIISLIPPIESGARFDVDLTPDWRVACYALALALLSTLAFTIAPALRAWRQDVLPALKAGEHGVIFGRSRLARPLVVTQLALSVVLLIAGGLALRSLSLVDTSDLGFRKDHLLLANVNTSGVTDPLPSQLERIRTRLSAIPGVTSVSWAVAAPPHSHPWMGMPASALGSSNSIPTDGTLAGPGYLHTLGVRILAGRDFTPADLSPTQLAAVINQKLADALFPHRSAIGASFTLKQFSKPLEVIGVVANAAFNGVAEDGSFSGLAASDRRPFVFVPDQENSQERTFHIRYSGDVTPLVPAVRAAIHQTDPRLATFSVRTLEAEWRDFTIPIRAIVMLLSFFALGALVLASVGLYAVTSFDASRRTREFGIRMALGATPAQTLRSVVLEALRIALIGLAVGLAICVGAGRALGHLLFGIAPTDTATYLSIIGLLTCVSIAAAYLPARRASRIDPIESLRE